MLAARYDDDDDSSVENFYQALILTKTFDKWYMVYFQSDFTYLESHITIDLNLKFVSIKQWNIFFFLNTHYITSFGISVFILDVYVFGPIYCSDKLALHKCKRQKNQYCIDSKNKKPSLMVQNQLQTKNFLILLINFDFRIL